MRHPVHILAVLSVCFGLALVGGCAEMADHVNSLGGKIMRRKSPEQLMHIKTPDDRIKELKQVAKTAKKKQPAEQQQLVGSLIKEFGEENEPIVRRHILRALTEFPQPEAGGLLMAALSDTDKETRRVACTCLGKRGGPQAVTELARVIGSDTDFDVRIAAVRALGVTGEKSALAPLAEAIVDPDPAMQVKAHESLTAVSGHDFGNDANAWREFAKNGKSDAPEISIAERLRRSVF